MIPTGAYKDFKFRLMLQGDPPTYILKGSVENER